METVRLGLIGAGGMANGVHYPSLAEFSDVKLVALCDLNSERLTNTANRFEIEKRYTDYRQMLDTEELDAVYVLMPPHHLFDIAIDVMEHKLNIFMEKPPGVMAEQTRQLANAAERNDVLSMVAFNRRYAPLIVKMKEAVTANGPMLQCVSTFYKNYIGQPAYYRGAIDILRCDAIHAVDMLRYMGGEIEHVASDVQSHNASYDNMFNALVRFESGGVGVLLTNWCVGGRRHQFEMHAEGISAYVNPDVNAELWRNGSSTPETFDTKEVAGSDENRVYYGFAGENRHFIDCVKAHQLPQTHFSDAVRSMELAERIYKVAW